jgi:hypothetical protein
MVISSLIVACVSLVLTFEPEFATRQLNHGAFVLTMLLLVSSHPTKTMQKRKLLANKAWYRRLTAMLSCSFSGFIAVASFYLVLQSFGYEFGTPEGEGSASVYAVNVAWFLVMIAIVELFSKFTEANFIQAKAQ